MKSDIKEAFVRQRRALVATSLALIAFQGLGATLHRVTLLGNTIELASPLSVTTPLWVAWVYFYLRYYQYLRSLGDKGFKSLIEMRMIELASRAALKLIKDQIRVEEFKKQTVRIVRPQMQRLSSPPGFWTFRATGGMAQITERSGGSNVASQSIEGMEVALPLGKPRFSRTRSTLWTVWNSHQGTEYGLPFLIGAVPPLVAILTLLC